MNGSFNKNLLKYSIITASLNYLWSIFWDKTEIEEGMYSYYVILCLSAFVISGFVYFKNSKKHEDFYRDLFLVIICSWGMMSQIFRNSGYMTSIIAFFAYSFYDNVSIKRYISYVVPMCILTALSIYFSDSFKGLPEFVIQEKNNSIQLLIFVVFFISFSHFFKIKNQEKLAKLESGIFDLGSKSAIFIHDLKNLTNPILNDAKFALKKDSPEEMKRMIERIHNNTQNLSNFIFEFNQSFSFKDEVSVVNLHEVVDSIKKMYAKKLENVSIEIQQSSSIVLEIKTLKSILSNMIINSADAFESNKILNRTISISLNQNKLTYLDNAGGVNPQLLDRFQNDDYFSTKSQGSGIGIYTIKKLSTLMKGKVRFDNKNNGLEITIDITK